MQAAPFRHTGGCKRSWRPCEPRRAPAAAQRLSPGATQPAPERQRTAQFPPPPRAHTKQKGEKSAFQGAPAVVEHAGLDDLGVQVALLARAVQDVLLDRARRHEHQHQHLARLPDAVRAVLRLRARGRAPARHAGGGCANAAGAAPSVTLKRRSALILVSPPRRACRSMSQSDMVTVSAPCTTP